MPGTVALEEPTWERAPTKLRALKTHWEAPYVPYNPDARYIVVIRDPKDVLVSGYHFADSILVGVSEFVAPETWARLFIAGRSPFGSWPAHTASFWAWRGRENVLLLHFEDMKADLEGAVRRVAAFMEVPLSGAQLEEVVHKSSFGYMKAINHKFAPPALAPGRDRATILRTAAPTLHADSTCTSSTTRVAPSATQGAASQTLALHPAGRTAAAPVRL